MTKEWMGARMKLAREERRMTQEQLAKKTSTSRGTISHIEMGRTWPKVSVLIKVALVLRVQTSYFFE